MFTAKAIRNDHEVLYEAFLRNTSPGHNKYYQLLLVKATPTLFELHSNESNVKLFSVWAFYGRINGKGQSFLVATEDDFHVAYKALKTVMSQKVHQRGYKVVNVKNNLTAADKDLLYFPAVAVAGDVHSVER